MPPLNIRLLGAPEVTFNQRPLSFRTRKVLALLVYLVVEGGMHSRESLMALLWPESPPGNAAVTLRGTLSRLRRALKPAGEVLLTERGKVSFNIEASYDLDLAWLAQAADPNTSPRKLIAILKLDRGEFLHGFSLPDAPEFDNWVAVQRENCQRQVEQVYDRLTQRQLADHDIAAALDTAARWVARATLSEEAYRRLMAAQALAGDRTAALQTYDRCQAVLEDEFGMEPARETVVLAKSIRQDRLPEEAIHSGKQAGSNHARLASSAHRGLLMPFEGRSEEHSQLVDAFHRASRNGAQIVTVIGAAGVGKTRLVGAFQEWLELDSPNVEIWSGRAFETGGSLPYQPVIEALRQRLEEENAPEDLLDDVWMAELSQLMPELRARYPDLPAPMAGDANFVRSRLFAAIATLGSALAAGHPAVFVLDDMQWADADTRDMLQYTARRWAESGTPILLLLTIRQESYAADPSIREWLTGLGRDVPSNRLLLDPLNGSAVGKLISRLADPAADETASQAFADWLWAKTHGLPFYIEALLQMLEAQGFLKIAFTDEASDINGHGYDFASALIQVRADEAVEVPPSVREAILARMERLPNEASELLLAAAVVARECSFERLRQVAELTEVDALGALEVLLNTSLLAEGGNVRRPYTLAHDYIREVAYNECPQARRRVFHRRALISLEAARGSAAECAYHANASLLDEPAFRFSLAAGDEALRSCAFQESLSHYNRARETAQRMGREKADIDSQTWLQLYRNRGRALELAYQYQTAQVNYQEMANLAAQRGDRALELAALIAQCIIHATHTSVFNTTHALELGQAALELAQDLDDKAAFARALWCMMLVEFHAGGDSQKILDYGERSLSLAEELGLKELMGYILGNLSWEYLRQEQIEAALKANHEAQSIWLSLGNLPMQADANTLRMAILRLSGKYEQILALGPEALLLSQSIENSMHESMALLLMGEAHCFQGRFGQAFASLEAAMKIIEGSGDALSLQGSYSYLILLNLFVGALDQAEHWADTLYQIREELMPVFKTSILANITRAKIALGKLREGQAVLDQALINLDRDGPSSHWTAPLFVADAHMQIALGNPGGVLERTEEIYRRCQQSGSRYYLAEALWLQGEARLNLEQVEEARDSLLKAKAVAAHTGERIFLWQILAALGQIESMGGNETQAESLRDQAGEIVNYIADHAGSQALRDSFLAQPRVRELIASPEASIPTPN